MKALLSYKEWLKSTKLKFSDSVDLYKEYKKYLEEKIKQIPEKNITEIETKKRYIDFLKRLYDLYKSEGEERDLIEYLDYNDGNDLKISIPYFARDLKNISKTISESRKDPSSYAKKYMDIDSIRYLKNSIYELFFKYRKELDRLGYRIRKDFSKVKIDVEELYDINEYFDKDPKSNVDDYFDIDDDLTKWVIGGGFNDTKDDDKASKYLSVDQYEISGNEAIKKITVENPTFNLLNIHYPTVATCPLVNNLYSASLLGGYSIPTTLGLSIFYGMSRPFNYELLDGGIVYKELFPNPSLYSDGVSLTKTYQDSPIKYNPTLNWVELKSSGMLNLIRNTFEYQEMIPYRTSYEIIKNQDLGLNSLNSIASPWIGEKSNQWNPLNAQEVDFRMIYDIRGWKNDFIKLTGEEVNWAVDLYGNNYGLYKNNIENPYSIYERKTKDGGKLYIKEFGKEISHFNADFFKKNNQCIKDTNFQDIEIDDIKEMEVYENIIVIVDSKGHCLIQYIDQQEENLLFLKNNGTIFNEKDEYKYFNHIYDNRKNVLYVCTYRINPTLNRIDIKLYEFKERNLNLILNSQDRYIQPLSYPIIDIKNKCMDINIEKDHLIISFSGFFNTDGGFILNYFYDLIEKNNLIMDRLLIECDKKGEVDGGWLNMISIKYFENKLIFLLEDVGSNNKYLQGIDLDDIGYVDQ